MKNSRSKTRNIFIRRMIVIEGGKVHDIGYKPFLLVAARYARLKGFSAKNSEINGNPAVEVLVEGTTESVEDFMSRLRKTPPEDAKTEHVRVEDKAPAYVLPIDVYDRILSIEQWDILIRAWEKAFDKWDKEAKSRGAESPVC